MTKTATLIAGMDIGDRFSYLHVLDAEGEMLEETRVPTTPRGLRQSFESRPALRIAIEVGTHSPWISRILEKLGHDVLVANPRQLRLIHSSTRKNDRLDAERLARLLRLDPALLSPVDHRDEEAQAALALVRARSALVSARTKLVNHARGSSKSRGHRLPSSSAAAFPKLLAEFPDELRRSLEPVGACITQLSIEIRCYDTRIKELSAERYPETELLRQVAGVGPVTALVFRLVVQHPARFPRGRQVGAYLGLVPRQDQSGGSDRQLRITKAGDRMTRTLLVQCAQRMLGPFGEDSDLRRWGLQLAARGGKAGKKRAVIGVARKLSVLLLALWRTGAEYEPLMLADAEAKRVAAPEQEPTSPDSGPNQRAGHGAAEQVQA